MTPCCEVCGAEGYWVAWDAVAREYRCLNHAITRCDPANGNDPYMED